MIVAGFSSTGSKRPAALFGAEPLDAPVRMSRSAGARLWDDRGREYLDFVMALGAVSLGYADPLVVGAVADAAARGMVGSLAPMEEELLAADLQAAIPWLERVRFLKTGAEAVAAAVRLARVHTGRDLVLGCGYHGWLDLASAEAGVPAAVRGLYAPLPFGDADRARTLIRKAGNDLAAVVAEPVVDGPPPIEWLECLRDECVAVGAVLVLDEIKTGFRLDLAGAVGRYGVRPDLVVYGKALGNGAPIAAVGGSRAIMDGVGKTWISSTLATEFVALAAARAALARTIAAGVPRHLARVGGRLHAGLEAIVSRFGDLVTAAPGIPEMCYLRFADEAVGARVAVACARRGVLFKRTAYNFVSLAHEDDDVDTCLAVLEESLAAAAR